jgi:hypothetical protein
MPILNREDWIQAAMPLLQREVFGPVGLMIPDNVRIGCGALTNRKAGAKNQRLGVCFPASSSADQKIEIFLSPELCESVRVLDVLCHEFCHAIDGNESGHGAPFRKLALAIGLTGKMTATIAGEGLTKVLSKIVEKIGEYPHAKLDLSGQKKQSTRMIKVACTACKWSFRTSKKNVEAMTSHTCQSCGGPLDSGEAEDFSKSGLILHHSKGEAQACIALVRRVVAAGYQIAVSDEEDDLLEPSSDVQAIVCEMGHSDMNNLCVSREEGWGPERLGTFIIYYGNAEDGSEIVSDIHATPEGMTILDGLWDHGEPVQSTPSKLLNISISNIMEQRASIMQKMKAKLGGYISDGGYWEVRTWAEDGNVETIDAGNFPLDRDALDKTLEQRTEYSMWIESSIDWHESKKSYLDKSDNWDHIDCREYLTVELASGKEA